MLKRAKRLAPQMRNRKHTTIPSWIILCRSPMFVMSGSMRNPHVYARMLGATPNVITSASESSSLPKSLAVFVIRAMRPSIESNGIANMIAIAA